MLARMSGFRQASGLPLSIQSAESRPGDPRCCKSGSGGPLVLFACPGICASASRVASLGPAWPGLAWADSYGSSNSEAIEVV
jgi:hypothetical protein